MDGIFRDAHLAAPAVAERDATDIRQIDALVRLAVVVETPRRGEIENMQRDEVAGAAAAIGGDDNEKAVVSRADIEVAGLFAVAVLHGLLLVV
jgi:hypothetical protein